MPAAEALLGEPFALYAELTNPHPEPVLGHTAFAWVGGGGGGEAWLQIMGSAGAGGFGRYMHAYSVSVTTPPPPTVSIPPGARYLTKILLLPTRFANEFPAGPGSISVKARFVDNTENIRFITSNTAVVRVTDPTGRDADALTWLRARKLEWALGEVRHAGFLLSRQERDLVGFVKQFGDTTYGPYARHSYGLLLFERKDFGNAATEFEAAAVRPATGIRDDAMYYAGECRRRLGQRAEARRWYDQVVERYPNTPAAEKAKEARPFVGAG